MAKWPQIEEEFVIEEIETLKIIADSRRLQIMKYLKKPRTVKEVAAWLNVPATKLYYHVNQLEKHGLIQVVATNVVSGIIEKQYQATANHYRVKDSLISTAERQDEKIDALLSAVFDTTKEDIRKGIKAGLINKNMQQDIFLRTVVSLPPDQIAHFAAKLEALVKECNALQERAEEENIGTQNYGLTIAFYPLAGASDDEAAEAI